MSRSEMALETYNASEKDLKAPRSPRKHPKNTTRVREAKSAANWGITLLVQDAPNATHTMVSASYVPSPVASIWGLLGPRPGPPDVPV